jgi:hypothetical protein
LPVLLGLIVGFVAVGAYVYSERQYWDRIESHWRSDAVHHVAKSVAGDIARNATDEKKQQQQHDAADDDSAAVVVAVVPVDESPSSDSSSSSPSSSSPTVLVVPVEQPDAPTTPAAEPADDAQQLSILDAVTRATEVAPVSPIDELSDVDSLLLADRLTQLIESQRVDAARAADPNNYLRSTSQLLDEAVQLARDADERAAAQAERIVGLEQRIRAVERFAVAQRIAAQRLHRLERATLGLAGALQEQRPFVNELQALSAASEQVGDVPLLQAAAALVSPDDARRGVMQTAALSELFVDIVEASKVAESMQHANNAPTGSDAPTWWKRAYASVVRNVTVWPAGVPDGNGPAAVAARANWYLEHGQLERCVSELRQISELPDVQKAAAAFLSEAERRVRLENVVSLAMSDIDRLLDDNVAEAAAANPHGEQAPAAAEEEAPAAAEQKKTKQ